MSDDEQTVAVPPGATTDDLDQPPAKPKYKSWRKKYRKMKTHFDDVLKENSSLFVEEQKLESLNKRLQEQNDQLLEILLDLNDSLKIPKSLRYDITSFHKQSDYDGYDFDQANAEIIDAHNAVQSGEYPQPAYHQFRSELEHIMSRRGVRTLEDLEERTPHPLPSSTDVDVLLQPEYLTSEQQDAYLLAMDAKQGDRWKLKKPLPPAPVKFGEMTPRELEREIEMTNYHSVHSWLKRHKAAEAQKDEDAVSEAGVATPATNKKRNNNLAKKVGDRAVNRARQGGADEAGSPASIRMDTEGADDDIDDSILLSASARKKGGDKDDTYRPKGGRSTKGKRKRDGDENSGTKGKKARTSMPASAAAAGGDA